MTFFMILTALATVWLGALAWSDCRYRRLPNYLTLPGVVIFPVMYYFLMGWKGVGYSLLGGAIGGFFLLIPYLLRGAGAGDVKMLLAVGCLSGYPGIFLTLFITSIAGLLLGAVMIAAGKTDAARVKHFFRSCFDVKYDRKAGKDALPEFVKKKVRIPYGVAIAAGMWFNLLYTTYLMLKKLSF